MTQDRSSRREVRNPVLALPAAQALLATLSPDQAQAFRAVFRDLATDSRARADKAWRTHKGPMAAYWKAVSVYSGHLARVLNGVKS